MKTISLPTLFLVLCIGLVGCDAGTGVTPNDLDAPASDATPIEGDANAVATSTSDVFAIADLSVVGSSTLKRSQANVGMWLGTSQIPARQAVTIWWVVFNNPAACATSPCGEPDLFVPEVKADILYASGNITHGPAGKSTFSGYLNEGDTTGSIADVFGLPAASGLHDALTAEVHLIVRSHGPGQQDIIRDQLTSFDGGCTTELPAGMMPDDEGECADVQFAVHVAE